jgi:hypothetical protein
MLNTRIITVPFAWYTTLQQQEQYTPGCAEDYQPFLISPSDRFLPFQLRIRKGSSPLTVSGINLSLICGTTILALDNNVDQFVITEDGADYILTYLGDTYLEFDAGSGLAPLSIPPGSYSGEILTNYGTYYSELFCVKTSLAPYLKLEWWGDCDLGGAVYTTGYKNRVFVDAIPLPAQMGIDEENEKDGFGADVPILQRFESRYRYTLPKMPHAAAIAITTIPMHRSANLITLPDGRNTTMMRVKVTPELFDCGAIVQLEFSEEVLVKGSCCD